MSYSRTYHGTVSGTVHYSYGPSESGGSGSETVEIPVTIEIDVDTLPLDRSVVECQRQVNILTGSVVATETAQIASRVQSTREISGTIVKGFFGLIKSEISQQLSEIKPRVEALMVELVQHQQSCIAKRKQLEGDYARITERYTKIFSDLDKELHNRIHLLNKSAIGARANLTTHIRRSFSDLSATISTIGNKEGMQLNSMILAGGLKNRALSLIGNGKQYLFSEHDLSVQLKEILSPGNNIESVTKHTPVLYFESTVKAGPNESQVYASEKIAVLNAVETKDHLKEFFSNSNMTWDTLHAPSREDINMYFQLELKRQSDDLQRMNPRVANQILQLWKNNEGIQSNH